MNHYPSIERISTRMKSLTIAFILFVSAPPFSAPAAGSNAAATGAGEQVFECAPTPPDAMGPFYKSDAPVRHSVGKGHVLSGTVKSADNCAPVEQARIELWMTGPDGRYDDKYRATLYSGESGAYRFESHFPPGYSGRPPHIHMRVTADGFKPLVTQYYPSKGAGSGKFDLVLIPQ